LPSHLTYVSNSVGWYLTMLEPACLGVSLAVTMNKTECPKQFLERLYVRAWNDKHRLVV